jgi:hypothetical protein
VRLCRKAQERKPEVERLMGPLWRRKALEGEAPERWELKEASEDRGTEITERVAKPWG